MKALTPGHLYLLDNFEEPDAPGQRLQFIEKVLLDDHPLSGGKMRTVQDGTTNEEVLAMLIDRLTFQHNRLPSKESAVALTHIETALLWLNKRTANRKARGVEGTMNA